VAQRGLAKLLRGARQHPSVSENASATEPAALLAIFIADDGVTLTTFEK
jgi:hypothetical protein